MFTMKIRPEDEGEDSALIAATIAFNAGTEAEGTLNGISHMRRALAAAYEAEADKLKADIGDRMPSDHPTYAGIYGWLRQRAVALRGDAQQPCPARREE